MIMAAAIGAEVVDSVENATHVVTGKRVSASLKLAEAIAEGKPIVHVGWLEQFASPLVTATAPLIPDWKGRLILS